MMSKKKKYDDDDGRTVADMSGVEGLSPLRLRPRTRKKGEERDADDTFPPPDGYFADKGERRAFIGGALKAVLLIALVYLAGFALVICLLTLAPR